MKASTHFIKRTLVLVSIALLSIIGTSATAQTTIQEHQVFTAPKGCKKMVLNLPATAKVEYKASSGSRVQVTTVVVLGTPNQAYQAIAKTGRYDLTATIDASTNEMSLHHQVKNLIIGKGKKIITEDYKVIVYVPQEISVQVHKG